MQHADMWLKGKLLFTHYGGYLPFSIALGKVLNYDKPNRLIVKADNADNAEVVFVYTTITDINGDMGTDAETTLQFQLKGDGKLIGQNPIKAEAGIATILLHAGS